MKALCSCFFLLAMANHSFSQITVQAETGTLSGVYVSTNETGYTGSGYVDGFDVDGDFVEWTVNIPSAGSYSIEFRYSASAGKHQYLDLNGQRVGSVSFPQTNGFESTNAGGLFMLQGNNTIRIEKQWGWFLLDRLTLTEQAPHDYNVSSTLIDPLASPNTQEVMNYLTDNYGSKVITGQVHYWDELIAVSGKSPKVQAFDFKSYTNGFPYAWNGGHTFGWTDNGTTDEIIDWYNSNSGCGIVSIQWHWHSPTGGSAGTNTFYTNSTSFDVTRAINPVNAEYDLIIEDIDSIASQLQKLEDKGIPVLWRPLHEAGGGWFWWGAQTSTACLELWDIMYDRLTNHHDLHNLIWVWSTPEVDWFPGNDKIDIIGYDSYPGAYNYTTQKAQFDAHYDLVNGEKLVALTENGPIPDIDDLFAQDAVWSYFASWNDLVTQQNSTQHIQNVYTHNDAINLDDSPCGIISSISESNSVSEHQAWPNPFIDEIHLNGQGPWLLLNVTGQIVAQGESSTLQVAHLPPGHYTLLDSKGSATSVVKN